MLRQVTDSYGPLPGGALEALESRIGGTLPTDFKQFLARYNGGRAEPSAFDLLHWENPSLARRFPKDNVHIFFGFEDDSPSDLFWNLDAYGERIPSGTLPIGCDPGGNLLLLGFSGDNSGKVFLWIQSEEVAWEEGETPDYSNVGLVADSFKGFLLSLRD